MAALNPHIALANANPETDYENRLAELEVLKSAAIANLMMAKSVRLEAARLGPPDWPAMQFIVALARLTAAMGVLFELVNPPDILLSNMDDAGINWRSLHLRIVEGPTEEQPMRNALPIL